ncbi:MAG: integrase family protein [Gemmataceae bacterium]|nr:integrase family protein [Gemmataceae bacterium]
MCDKLSARTVTGGWEERDLNPRPKIVKRAGLKTWLRLFHNLRSGRETDLMKGHPIHAVCVWIGNTPAVALKHYLQVLDSDFDRAVKEVQNGV